MKPALLAAQEYHSAYADWIQAGKDGRAGSLPNLVEIIERHYAEAKGVQTQRLTAAINEAIPLIQRNAGFWAMQVAGPARQALNILRRAIEA